MSYCSKLGGWDGRERNGYLPSYSVYGGGSTHRTSWFRSPLRGVGCPHFGGDDENVVVLIFVISILVILPVLPQEFSLALTI